MQKIDSTFYVCVPGLAHWLPVSVLLSHSKTRIGLVFETGAAIECSCLSDTCALTLYSAILFLLLLSLSLERKKERERDRDTHTHTHTEREREMKNGTVLYEFRFIYHMDRAG